MSTVNMLEAKTHLSRLVEAVESGSEAEIVIARNGRPVARLVPIEAPDDSSQRIGIAKGLFRVPDTIDGDSSVIGKMFGIDPP